MGDETIERFNLAGQAAQACQQFVAALHALQDLSERRPFLGNFLDTDFIPTGTGQGTAPNGALKYLDAGTIGTLFDIVVPRLLTAYADAGNGGQAKQILNQVSP